MIGNSLLILLIRLYCTVATVCESENQSSKIVYILKSTIRLYITSEQSVCALTTNNDEINSYFRWYCFTEAAVYKKVVTLMIASLE